MAEWRFENAIMAMFLTSQRHFCRSAAKTSCMHYRLLRIGA
jgi:hypothetical protein